LFGLIEAGPAHAVGGPVELALVQPIIDSVVLKSNGRVGNHRR